MLEFANAVRIVPGLKAAATPYIELASGSTGFMFRTRVILHPVPIDLRTAARDQNAS